MDKFWNVLDVDEEVGTVELIGDVCSSTPTNIFGEQVDGKYITPDGFKEDFEKVKDKKKLNIVVSSKGGDVGTGIAIYNALLECPAEKTGIVRGLAASAGTFPLCACDHVKVGPADQIFVHGVMAVLKDGGYNAQELDERKRRVEAADAQVAAIYARKTGRTVDEMLDLMHNKTWMTGSQAITEGFADIFEQDDAESPRTSADRKTLYVAGLQFDMDGLEEFIPESIPTEPTVDKADGNKNTASGGEEGGNPMADENKDVVEVVEEVTETTENALENITTVDELRNAFPELVEDIEKAAADKAMADERERMKAIEHYANAISDEKFIADAKYEHPMDASAFAIAIVDKYLENGQRFNEQVVDALESDALEAKAGDIGTAPAPVEMTTEEQMRAAIDAAAAEVHRMKEEGELK